MKRLIKEGLIAESDEGRWTIKTAIDEAVPVPVLTPALSARFSSRGEADRRERLRDVTHMLAMNAKRAKATKQASRVVLVILVFETFVTHPWQ